MILDDEQRRLHARRSTRVMFSALFVLIFLIATAPVWAAVLQNTMFLRFDLGFFVIAHGMVLGIISVVYWFISTQEDLDRNLSISAHV